MTVRNQIRFIVYRIHEKGLEVLLNKPSDRDDYWAFYQAQLTEDLSDKAKASEFIELDTSTETGAISIAIEADWHDLPRVRNLLKSDINYMTEAITSKLPEFENGAYVAIKEAIKKIMPQEYEVLKELKEILLDRNSVKNI